jgi:hypothetical protein
MAQDELTAKLKTKFANLPKAKKDEIAWYSARGYEAYATLLFLDAIGVQRPYEPKGIPLKFDFNEANDAKP